MTRAARPLLSAVAVGALLAGAAPAGAADPLPGAFDLTPRACPVATTPLPPFGDIGSSAFVPEIACIAAHGISVGTSATLYSPQASVTRRQMATFL